MIPESKKARFTVVVPTRERSDSLAATLRTCVAQEYPGLEILVSDNASGDQTHQVVASFGDQRIRYINTGRRVGMSQNWEYALNHVEDGYVMFLGDDDGLLPGGLTEIARIITATDCDALSWESAGYVWPGAGDDLRNNSLQIPLRQGLCRMDARRALTEVVNLRRKYTDLNFLYRGVVKYSVLKRLKNESGSFFHSMIPDLYGGIAVASLIDSFYYSRRPFTLNGRSRHSGGTAYFSPDEGIKDAADKFLNEENLPFHPRLVLAPSIAILTAESVLQVQEHVPSARRLAPDLCRIMAGAMREAAGFPAAKHAQVAKAVQSIGALNGIDSAVVMRLLKRYPNRTRHQMKPVEGVNLVHGYVLLNCDPFRVADVYDAAVLCQHVLTWKRLGISSPGGLIASSWNLARRACDGW